VAGLTVKRSVARFRFAVYDFHEMTSIFLERPTPPLVLAPMAGVSDAPFRQLCRSYGADIVMSEFLSSEALRRGVPHVHDGARFREVERPIGIQIYGADPSAMAEAAGLVTEHYQPDFIDINFGCPVKKVVRRNGGSACLKDLNLVQRIIRSVRDATSLLVSVKIRSGWDEATRDPVEIALRCEEAGAQMLTLHARTRSQRYRDAARWAEIAEVVAALEIPVIGNGDILDAADAHRMRCETGCAAMMIARGSFGRPWIFRQARDILEGKEPTPTPDALERFVVARRHRDLIREMRGDSKNVACEFRKHLGWYTKGLDNSAGLRAKLHQIESLADIEPILKEYLKAMEIAA
jgi:tRNA-dihydrouridine synthase B